ncbi:MAG: hypothetical protein AB7F64_08430, partial [Gammaproteobacteria bacterium]
FISNPDKDQFVDVNSSVMWSRNHKKNGVVAIQCNGMHGLEFERGIGSTLRKNTVQFINDVLSNTQFSSQYSSECVGI